MRYCGHCTFNSMHPKRIDQKDHLNHSLPGSSWCSDACMLAAHAEFVELHGEDGTLCCSRCWEMDPNSHPDVLCPEHSEARTKMKVKWWDVPKEEFTVRVFPDPDIPGTWVATLTGAGLDGVTCGAGPVHTLRMAAEWLKSATNRCDFPHENEHCWCRSDEQPWDYVKTPGDEQRMLYANVAIKTCCRCGTSRRADAEEGEA